MEEKNTNNYDIQDLDLEDIIGAMSENVRDDIKCFEDIVNIDGAINREVYVGDINAGLGQTIDGWIRFWNRYDDLKRIPVEEREPIKIYIDSNGGCLTDTFTMIDAIEMSKTPIWTIVTGSAYSGGFFTGITKCAKRIAYPHASFMFHEGSTSTGGDAHKFRNYADFYEKELEQLKNHVLKSTKISEEKYESIKRDDFWLTAEEALEYGVIDEIAKELI